MQYLPVKAAAETSLPDSVEQSNLEIAFAFSQEVGGEIPLYQEQAETSTLLTQIPDDSEVTILDKGTEFTKVSYEESQENIWIGYVRNDRLVDASLADKYRNERLNQPAEQNQGTDNEAIEEPIVPEDETSTIPDQENPSQPSDEIGTEEEQPVKQFQILATQTTNGIALKDPTHVYESPSTSSTILKSYDQGTILKFKALAGSWYEVTVYVNGTAKTGYILVSDTESIVSVQETQVGIGIQNPTKIYSKATTNSEPIKEYNQGTLLKYKTFSKNWYEATVYVGGIQTTGYIHASDITQEIQGIALKDPTHVYTSASTSSSILKSYNQGIILKVNTYSADWYKATVIVNGSAKSGYIRTADLQFVVQAQETLHGIGMKSPTNIYTKASKTSKVLKAYAEGTILKYRTLSKDWYEATVMVKGTAKKGYISANDVQNIVLDQETLRGIGMESPTKIYSKAATSSSVLKSYAQGTILKYRTLSRDWYEATVIISGKARSGYIHAADVQNIVAVQESLRGIAAKSPTKMYAKASKSSKVIKSYNQGIVLKYKTLSKDWYEATVVVNGKKTTVYIAKGDVETATSTPTTQYVLGLLKSVNVYSYASTNAKVLRSYGKNNVLKVKTFTSSWYECTFYIDGKENIGYIKKSDVRGSYSTVHYDISLEDAIKKQLGYNPQTDLSGSWSKASTDDVKYYLNPLNFHIGTDAYFQFLLLSSYAGTNATEVNQKILSGKGILAGKASSFISAAKEHKINEIYLISHALLETGNGTSRLANGITVNGKTVYNVYGIGAVDSNPETQGAQYAYDHGWTTVEKAIIGGAEFVAENYIHAGQDTLYKMRWNPDAMVDGGTPHQYASDIGWAVKQTARIAEMYGLLSKYALFFDVPDYI